MAIDDPGNDAQTGTETGAASRIDRDQMTNGSPVQTGVFGAAVAVLMIGALVTMVSLARSTGGDADRLTIEDAPGAATAPAATFDASIGDQPDFGRDISITDEPIVIDADGNIVDPQGGTGIDTQSSESNAPADVEFDLPDDVFTGESANGSDGPVSPGGAATPPESEDDSDDSDDSDDGLNLLGGDDPEDRRMPDLICRGLQAAQDEIQDRGVFGSKSEDATGRGRRQLWDRNWVVVAQDPAPGEQIGEFEAVLYVVKKSDDENICD